MKKIERNCMHHASQTLPFRLYGFWAWRYPGTVPAYYSRDALDSGMAIQSGLAWWYYQFLEITVETCQRRMSSTTFTIRRRSIALIRKCLFLIDSIDYLGHVIRAVKLKFAVLNFVAIPIWENHGKWGSLHHFSGAVTHSGNSYGAFLVSSTCSMKRYVRNSLHHCRT